MPSADVLIVSLGGTAGLREADAALAESLRRAGAAVAVATARPPRPGAIRFDAPAAGNRPGRHGLWQRPVEARRLAAAPLLVPWSEGGLAEAPEPHADALIVPVPVAPSGPPGERDIAAVTYAANPEKKGLDRVLAAWLRAAGPDEELVVAGLDAAAGGAWLERAAGGAARPAGRVRFAGLLARGEYRALLRRARRFVAAPRREDYGIAQLEALADGCVLVTTPAPGPYAALPIARALDARLVTGDLATALRIEPAPGYAERAAARMASYAPAAVDRVVAEALLPRLIP